MKLSSKMLDGRYLTKEAAKAGLVTRKGKGDHFIIEAPTGRGYMTCPQREIGRGLASEIVKWLVRAGVTFVFAALLVLAFASYVGVI